MRRSIMAAMAALLAAGGVLCGSAPAWAHDSVAPSAVVVGEHVTVTLSVANENELPTDGIEMRLPPGFTFTSAEDVPGWRTAPQRRADGAVTAVRWTGGLILPDAKAQFVVVGTAPASSGTLAWSAAQKAVGASDYGPAPTPLAPKMAVRPAALADPDATAVEGVPLARTGTSAPVDGLARSRATLALVLAGLALLGVLAFGSASVRRAQHAGHQAQPAAESVPTVSRSAARGEGRGGAPRGKGDTPAGGAPRLDGKRNRAGSRSR